MDRLKAMETFVRIARAGSMAKAADQMGVSRAIVSTHLSQLEAHLGARLFNRTTRQLVLTEIGAEYLASCIRLMADLEDMELSVSHLQKEPRGHVKIASPLIFGHFLLAPLISAFIKSHPDISANIFLYDSRMTPVLMIESAFDIVIQLGRVEDSSLASRTLGEIRYLVCASPGYLEEHGSPSVPEELARHNCLVHKTRTPDSIWQLLDGENVRSVKVSGSLSSNSDTTLRAAVRTGLGIAVLPAFCIAREIASGEVVELLKDFVIPMREITALIPHSRQIPHKTRVILDYLSSELHR